MAISILSDYIDFMVIDSEDSITMLQYSCMLLWACVQTNSGMIESISECAELALDSQRRAQGVPHSSPSLMSASLRHM